MAKRGVKRAKSKKALREPARASARGESRTVPPARKVSEAALRQLIFRTFGHQRFTQDSPILPEVWLSYARQPNSRQDLILTPTTGHNPGNVALELQRLLTRYHRRAEFRNSQLQKNTRIAYSRSSVVVQVTFDELMCVLVPMTTWWKRLPGDYTRAGRLRAGLRGIEQDWALLQGMINTTEKWEYYRFAILAGFVAKIEELPDPEQTAERLASTNDMGAFSQVAEAYLRLMQRFKDRNDEQIKTEIWSISVNRTTATSVYQSLSAVKGDAAQNLFKISTSSIAWAIIDCGIDATHPAFQKRPPKDRGGPSAKDSRVQATYDFTILREVLASESDSYTFSTGKVIKFSAAMRSELEDLRRRVSLGREIDWDAILPIISIPHKPNDYQIPIREHGTHVAGILAGNWPAEENEERQALIGLCPDLQLYDFRVFDNNGNSDEFTIMAALQVVAHLNRARDNPVIHGVNLSLSLRHEVMTYACGRTPICEECTRLVGDGVVVVAAAGNQGFEDFNGANNLFGTYRGISITDPGNAEAVITVGATHRSHPHAYGVSYFSSRGPTGDGRRKPDLVAPGEKITAPIPNSRSRRMDGTSMAAPHVSGAAALLMARYRELIGRPMMIKQVLCKSATDLGRELDFQGAGMLDVLRALQSV